MSLSTVTDILTVIDDSLYTFVFNGYHAMVSKLRNWLLGLITLSIAGFGWALMRGMIDMPLQRAASIALKIGFVILLGTNWDYFSVLIYDVVNKGPDDISAALLRANTDFLGFLSVESGLQKMLAQGLKKTGELFHQAGISNLTPCLVGMLVLISTLLICGRSIGILVLAKAGLAVCLILAPLMLALYLFESTKHICEKWIQHLVGFALMPIGVHAVMLLVLSMANNSLDKMSFGKQITLVDCASYLIVSIITIPLLSQVSSLMASLAHGISLSTMGAFNSAASSGASPARGAARTWKRWNEAKVAPGSNVKNFILSSIRG